MGGKRIITTLALARLRHKRTTSLFALSAIILTTLLFTSLFTLTVTFIESYEQETMRQVGTSAHAGFKELTDTQFQRLSSNRSIREYSRRVFLSMAENPQLSSRQTQIEYMDSLEAQWCFCEPEAGSLPEEAGQIATDTLVLDLLGIERTIGAQVPLTYTVDGVLYHRTFTLSGYWEGDPVAASSSVLISKQLLDSQLARVDQQKNRTEGILSGLNSLSVRFSSSARIEEKVVRIIEETGYDPSEIEYGINWAYLSGSLWEDGQLLLFTAALLALIALAGYLIIYNIFSISVVSQIRHLGLLRTIGTTKRQLLQYIGLEVLVLCIIGIPVGSGIGYGVGRLLSPLLMVVSDLQSMRASFDYRIFLFSALFSALTVLFSAFQPARRALAVSPVEGVRYQERMRGSSRLIGIASGNKSLQLALGNLLRQPGRTLLVVLSLSLSLVLLNVVVSFSSSFDIDRYLKNLILTDYQISISSDTDPRSEEELPSYLPEVLQDSPWFLEGGRVLYALQEHELDDSRAEAYRRELLPLLEERDSPWQTLYRDRVSRGVLSLQLYGLDPFLSQSIEPLEGVVDSERFDEGGYVIISPERGPDGLLYDHYQVGQTIELEGREGPLSLEVMAIADLPYALSMKRRVNNGFQLMLPAQLVESEFPQAAFKGYHFDIVEGQDASCERALSNLPGKTITYRSRASYRGEYSRLLVMVNLIGGMLVAVMALIGLVNFLNTTLTGLYTRRHEFALLRSVGMTTGQLVGMLLLEGALIALSTTLVSYGSILASSPLVASLMQNVWASSGQVSLTSTCYSIPLLLALSLLVPILAFKGTEESIIDSLRASDEG